MKILITGASGLIGKNLIKKMLDRGYSINFFTTQKNKINSIKNCNGFYWNPSRGNIDLKAFEGVSQLIHLAGASISKPWTKSYKNKIIDSRVLSSQIIYNSLVDINYRLDGIVSASAIGGYLSSNEKIYKESDSLSTNTFLGRVVSKWEHSVDELEIHSERLTKFRIGLVLSDKGGFLSKLIIPIKFGLGSAFGDGNQWQSWIHIDDLCELIIYSIEKNYHGIYNAVSNNPLTQNSLIKKIGKEINRPIFFPNIPGFVLKLFLGERSQLIMDSHKVSSDKIIKSGFKFKYNHFEDAIKNLKLN